ncbi:tyrosine-type recombinase/integrase [Desulfofalx alkaliphila]|uniref:tyrosine-type recombinase/integrase n=1 Tax=Desulfofalx alkaliphila TaxID=105483 RepID=UPI0004E1D183|nr:tyrosine-type recombinase/integrase [Desulfofalx alkaliphila]
MITDFKNYLLVEDKSNNTILSYLTHVQEYLAWFKQSYGIEFTKLYRENVLEFKSYLLNIKKFKGKGLSATTINAKLNAMIKFNKFLVTSNYQSNICISKEDLIKVQKEIANPADITKLEVEGFRQAILEAGDRRLFAIVTLLAYSGLRISEALNIGLEDFNLHTKELIIRKGKGQKQRIVYLNSKIVTAIKEYLKVRHSDSQYLFVSRQSGRVDRTVINKAFKKFNDKITPHKLRHFYCSNAIASGLFGIHEVANQAGHTNIQTTMIYTNPNKEEMKRKADLL